MVDAAFGQESPLLGFVKNEVAVSSEFAISFIHALQSSVFMGAIYENEMTEKTKLAEHESLRNRKDKETRDIESRIGKQRTIRYGLQGGRSCKK